MTNTPTLVVLGLVFFCSIDGVFTTVTCYDAIETKANYYCKDSYPFCVTSGCSTAPRCCRRIDGDEDMAEEPQTSSMGWIAAPITLVPISLVGIFAFYTYKNKKNKRFTQVAQAPLQQQVINTNNNNNVRY